MNSVCSIALVLPNKLNYILRKKFNLTTTRFYDNSTSELISAKYFQLSNSCINGKEKELPVRTIAVLIESFVFSREKLPTAAMKELSRAEKQEC